MKPVKTDGNWQTNPGRGIINGYQQSETFSFIPCVTGEVRDMSGDPCSVPAVLVAGVSTPEPLGALYPDYIGHCSSKCEYNNHNDGVMVAPH